MVAVTEEAEDLDDDGVVSIGAIFTFVEGELQTFVGSAVAPSYALVGSGAQHGVLGPRAFQNICDVLAEFGLKRMPLASAVHHPFRIQQSFQWELLEQVAASTSTWCHEVPPLLPVGFPSQVGHDHGFARGDDLLEEP